LNATTLDLLLSNLLAFSSQLHALANKEKNSWQVGKKELHNIDIAKEKKKLIGMVDVIFCNNKMDFGLLWFIYLVDIYNYI